MDSSVSSLAASVSESLNAANRELEQIWGEMAEVSEFAGSTDQFSRAIRRVAAYNPSSKILDRRPEIKHAVEHISQIIVSKANELATNPDLEHFASLGHCYLLLTDFPNAYAAYTAGIRTGKETADPYFWYGIGCVYQNFKYPKEASVFLQRAMVNVTDPMIKADIHVRLGIAERDLGNYDLSLHHFEATLETLPRDLTEDDIRFQMACTMQFAKRQNEAGEIYAKLHQKHRTNLTVLQQYCCFLALQNDQRSLDQGAKLAASVPDDVTLKFVMAKIAMKQSNLEKAYECYRELIPCWNDSPLVWYGLGVLYLRNDQTKDADVAFRRAVQANPQCEEAWLNVGLISELDHPEQALSIYQTALESCPDSKKLKERLIRLQSGRRADSLSGMIEEVSDGKFFTQIPDRISSEWIATPPKIPASAFLVSENAAELKALEDTLDDFFVPYRSHFT